MDFINIEWKDSHGVIRELQRCKQEIHDSIERSVKIASLRLEKEIKIVITEYAQSHQIIRHKKLGNDSKAWVDGKRVSLTEVPGSALIDTGFYRMNWTSFVDNFLGNITGHVVTNTEYAKWLEDGTRYNKAYKIVWTAWIRCKAEVYEIIEQSIMNAAKGKV
jgi:hypothetical protein